MCGTDKVVEYRSTSLIRNYNGVLNSQDDGISVMRIMVKGEELRFVDQEEGED